MHTYKEIFCFALLFVVCYAAEKQTPLKNYEGPWTIRNASNNALPIIGKCPSMKLEPPVEDSDTAGIVVLKTKMRTILLTVTSIDHENYQLFVPSDPGTSLIGNLSVIHAEENSYLITEIQTEDQVYYAVLTKEDNTSQDTNRQIENIWKSSEPTTNVTLASVEYNNCSEAETNNDGHEIARAELSIAPGGYSATTSKDESTTMKGLEGETDGYTFETTLSEEGNTSKTTTNVTPKIERKLSLSAVLPLSSTEAIQNENPDTLPIRQTRMKAGSGVINTASYSMTIVCISFYLLIEA